MLGAIVELNMCRRIATLAVQRRFVSIQDSQQVAANKARHNSLWQERRLQHPTKVPQEPVQNSVMRNIKDDKPSIALTEQTVRLLERLSLVNLDSKEAYNTLQDSIEFASHILPIDTDGVEPLYCVSEQRKLTLRSDIVDDGDRQEEVLKNAALTEEEYFVAPPGNIPLDQAQQV